LHISGHGSPRGDCTAEYGSTRKNSFESNYLCEFGVSSTGVESEPGPSWGELLISRREGYAVYNSHQSSSNMRG
jgi:hypothetical protein